MRSPTGVFARAGVLAVAFAGLAARLEAHVIPPFLYAPFAFAPDTSRIDLLAAGRNLAHAQGMREARDTLEMLAASQDATGGAFEQDLIHAARDGSYVARDALETLPLTSTLDGVSRSDVTFLFVNGLAQTHGSRGSVLLDDAVAHLRTKGFAADILTTSPYSAAEHNAGLLLPQLGARLESDATRHVIIVAVSKGAHDFLHALARNVESPAPLISTGALDKIKLVISMSGIVRSSAVAGWLVHSKGLVPGALRSILRSPLGRFPHLDGIESLTRDPWARLLANDAVPLRCPWLSFVVFPDGNDGQPKVGALRSRMLRLLKGSSEIGPYDGLTESASSLLPPGTHIEQWIVRVRGAHGIVTGKYADGTPVVARSRGIPAAQIIDPLLKSIPVSTLTD
jgi:hypothetical protein